MTKAGVRLAAALRLACAVPGATMLAGCASEMNGLGDRLPPYTVTETKPRTTIEKALVLCPEKTEAKERDCVTKALADSGLGLRQLVSEIPGCQMGRLCQFRYTTVDRLGFLASTAAEFKVRWLVSLDFRHAPDSVSRVPVSVAIVGT